MQIHTHAAPWAGRPLTDIDAGDFAAHFDDPIHQDRPDYLLHMVRAPQDKYAGPSDATLATLLSGRDAAGVMWTTCSTWIDPGEWTEWLVPEGLDASALPVVGKPRVMVWRLHAMSLGRVGPNPGLMPKLGLKGVVADTRMVVVHVPGGLDHPDPVIQRTRLEWMGKAGDVLDAVGNDLPVMVVAPDGGTLGGRAELDGLARPIQAWRRFHFSYAANFAALGMPALDAALAIPDPDAVDAYIDIYRPPETLRRNVQAHVARGVRARAGTLDLLDPLVLQALYAIRRAGSLTMPDGTFMDAAWDLALASGGSAEGAWTGTGKHPPRRITHREARGVAIALLTKLLVASDGSAVRLSRIGEAFLDGLHPACEDADLPLRWHGRWAERGPADAKAMDAWIARTFAKLKGR